MIVDELRERYGSPRHTISRPWPGSRTESVYFVAYDERDHMLGSATIRLTGNDRLLLHVSPPLSGGPDESREELGFDLAHPLHYDLFWDSFDNWLRQS